MMKSIIKLRKVESKYYTPAIDEFYVGFEYEKRFSMVVETLEKRQENNWHPVSFKILDSLEFLQKEMEFEDIRVKYLDKEDIESLGWINENNLSFPHSYIIVPKTDKVIPPKYYSMNFSYREPNLIAGWENKVIIQTHYRDTELNTLFRGIINNKSELKKLMKQLNIK